MEKINPYTIQVRINQTIELTGKYAEIARLFKIYLSQRTFTA